MNRRDILAKGLQQIPGPQAEDAEVTRAAPGVMNRRGLLKTAALVVGSKAFLV